MHDNNRKIPDTLLPIELRIFEQQQVRYHLAAAPGTTKKMLLDPDYWVHVARRLKRGDIVDVLAQDGSFDVELRVAAVDPRGLWAKMIVRNEVDLPERAPAAPSDKDGYRIEFSGPHKWRILDRVNNVVEKGLESEAEAVAKLAEIKKAKVR